MANIISTMPKDMLMTDNSGEWPLTRTSRPVIDNSTPKIFKVVQKGGLMDFLGGADGAGGAAFLGLPQ